MFDIPRRLDGPRAADIVDEIYLDHLQREKSRLRTQTLKGSEARIILDRGKPLRPGDILLSDCGHQLRVRGAKEPVITAISSDWKQFSRACYHLGNRHVRLQLGERWLRITPDHVLEALLRSFGLEICHERAVFEPEPGAYDTSHGSTHTHHHGHAHSHDHHAH